MSTDFHLKSEQKKTSNFATAGAVIFATAFLTGCSSVPNWANPVGWYESASQAIFGGDESKTTSPGPTKKNLKTTGEGKEFPNLASVPKRPTVPTRDGSKSLAKRLAADRDNAKNSEDKLKRQSLVAPLTPPPAVAVEKRPLARPLPQVES